MSVAPGDKRGYRGRGERCPTGGMRLTDRDRAVLRDVFLQRAVTRKQLMGLGHFSSITSASERLRILFDHRFLERFAIATDLATTELVYTVGPQAISELVSDLGVDRDEVKRCVSSGAPLALAHCVAVTDARIAFTDPPEGTTVEWLSEVQVRHEFVVDRARHVLKPDGALLVSLGDQPHIGFLEVDRGNVSQPQFERSCNVYRTYFDLNLHTEAYGARSASLIGIVCAGERRLRSLLALAAHAGIAATFSTWTDISEHSPYGAVWRQHADPETRIRFVEAF
ncbi:MAG TPA: replication-relaxation family protein [Fimbriimonadaceae bacterium]|nr:replication-relaxation family protein [Fimbriimonadaceae bacterium]